MPTKDYVRWFSDIRISDEALVGGKRNGRHVGIYGEAASEQQGFSVLKFGFSRKRRLPRSQTGSIDLVLQI